MAKRFPIMIFIRKMHDSKLPYVYDYNSPPKTLKRIIGTQSPKKADFNLNSKSIDDKTHIDLEKKEKNLNSKFESFIEKFALI